MTLTKRFYQPLTKENKMRPSQDEYFMLQAKQAACHSTCNSRPQGAVLVRDRRVIATGYNGALSGKEHCSDQPLAWVCWKCNGSGRFKDHTWDPCPECKGIESQPYYHRRASGIPDSQKDRACVSSHAEANAIAQAARLGIATEGAILYCTTSPCVLCTKLLVQAGVIKVFYELDYESNDGNWLKVLLMEQLQVSCQAVELAQAMLTPFTSRRRLAKTE